MTVTALIVAAGKSERMGGSVPKQFRNLGGLPLVRRAVVPLAAHPGIDEIAIVIPQGQEEVALRAIGGTFPIRLIAGGATRAQSVRGGLAAIGGDKVLIHDAARPFCPAAVIDRLLDALANHQAAVPVVPVSDTLARADDLLGQPIARENAVRVQTPQAFRLAAIRDAYARWSGPDPTDESTVARAAGIDIKVVAGAAALEKLTTEEDWMRAEAILAARLIPRVGFGHDVHAFAGDGPVILGGIAVPHERGLSGHSDADVVLHAITDALLGAAGLGDIGMHFPPSDARWKGASSDRFLLSAVAQIIERGGIIDHIDCTIICEAPKIGPYREAMCARVAEIAGVDPSQVNIKATTTEGLGFTGRREGIAAQAVATIRMERIHG